MVLTERPAPRLTWNLVDDVASAVRVPVHGQRLRAGTIVAVMAARRSAGSWCCAARASPATRSPVVGFPGAAGATSARRERRCTATSASASPPRWSIWPSPRSRGRGLQPGVGGHRHRAGVRPRLRLPVRQPLPRLPRTGQRPAVRQLPRHHRRPGRSSCSLVAVGVARGARASSAGRCCSPRSIPPSPPPAASRCGGCRVVFLVLLGLAAAEASQITGALLVFALLVMPAATAQRLTARPVLGLSDRGRHRAGRDLGRLWRRLLLALPDRLLGHDAWPSAPTSPRRLRTRRARRGDRVGARGVTGVLARRCWHRPRASVACSASPFMRNAFLAGTAIAAGLRPRRLLPRAAQPGVHRRRPQPRRLHRRPRRPGLRARPAPRAVRRHHRRRGRDGDCSGPRARPTTS